MAMEWELIAVALAVAYLALAIRQSIWCWPAAIGSTGIYIFLMYHAGLYMESALQVFYVVIAIYGWKEWATKARPVQADPVAPASGKSLARAPGIKVPKKVVSWAIGRHGLVVSAVLISSLISGALLSRYSEAALPYADSLTTWGAIVATWMVAKKVLENWVYWFVIDAILVFLAYSRGLYWTAGLYFAYLPLVVIGYRAWRESMHSPIESSVLN